MTRRLAVEPVEARTVPAAYTLDPGSVSAQVGASYSDPNAQYTDGGSFDVVDQVVPIADGGALVLKHTVAFGPASPVLVRLDAAGQLVSSFGTDGKLALTSVGFYGTDARVAVQPDGQILVASTRYDSGSTPTFTVARFDAAGRPDTAFGAGGVRALDRPGFLTRIALQPDGKILLGGSTPVVILGATGGSTADVAPASTADILLARLTAAGDLDRTFNPGLPNADQVASDGYQVVPLPGAGVDQLRDMAVLQDGRIVLAGTSPNTGGASANPRVAFINDAVSVVRLLPDGALDAGFGAAGVAAVDFGAQGVNYAGLAVRPDGRVVVGAVTNTVTPSGGSFQPGRAEVVQLTASGALDPAFGGGDGRFVVDAPAALKDLALDAAGRVVLVGATSPASLARLAADGSRFVDAFAPVAGTDPSATQVPDVVLDPAGRVYVGVPGTTAGFVTPLRVARLDPPRAAPAGRFRTDLPTPAGVDVSLGGPNGSVTQVTGSGPGRPPAVTLASSQGVAAPARETTFAPFEAAFTGGVFVDAANFNADGYADLVVTAGAGGGAVVAVYDGARLAAGRVGEDALLVRFLGIPDAAFRGGARAALGDVTGDGVPDLAVAAGVGGGPRVTVWDGRSVGAGSPARVADFFAFESTFRNGVNVALGDTNADGVADLLFGAGPGGGPRVREFDGVKLFAGPGFGDLSAAPAGAQRRDEFVGDPAARAGAPVQFVADSPTPAPTPVATTPAAARAVQPPASTPLADPLLLDAAAK